MTNFDNIFYSIENKAAQQNKNIGAISLTYKMTP